MPNIDYELELKKAIVTYTQLACSNHFLSVNRLADFIQNEIEFNKSPVKIISQRDRNTEQFLHWLMQPEIIEKLERAFFENINEPYADNFAIAIDILNCAIST